MAEQTAISWTQHTWNPWRGCTKISPGCKHCYMFTAQEKRARQTGNLEMWNPERVIKTTTWREPARWQRNAEAAGKTENVFTCSWSDFFHPDADQWRAEAWNIIERCPNLIFQILTKRPERIMQPEENRLLPWAPWEKPWPNVWLGVSVENPDYLWRVDELRKIPAHVRFISAEPLLARLVGLNLTGIDWVIVGGESGSGFRPMPHQWAREILGLCKAQGVAFFFKQSAAARTEMGTQLDGREWKEYPPARSPARTAGGPDGQEAIQPIS